MADLLHFTKLVELFLVGIASFYLGHQTAKPREERHWVKIKKKLTKKKLEDPPFD